MQEFSDQICNDVKCTKNQKFSSLGSASGLYVNDRGSQGFC